jgi:hypothetical protein
VLQDESVQGDKSMFQEDKEEEEDDDMVEKTTTSDSDKDKAKWPSNSEEKTTASIAETPKVSKTDKSEGKIPSANVDHKIKSPQDRSEKVPQSQSVKPLPSSHVEETNAEKPVTNSDKKVELHLKRLTRVQGPAMPPFAESSHKESQKKGPASSSLSVAFEVDCTFFLNEDFFSKQVVNNLEDNVFTHIISVHQMQ